MGWQLLLEMKDCASVTSVPARYLIRLIVKVKVKETKIILYC